MKRQSFFIVGLLSAVIALSSCGGSKTKPEFSSSSNEGTFDAAANFQKSGLQGNVISVRQRVYWALEKFGRMEKGKLQNMPYEDFLKVYNEYGLLVEETHFDAKDSIVSRQVNTYDKTQLKKEEFFNTKKCTAIIEYSYEGNLLKQKDIQDGDGKLKERYIYSYYEGTKLVQDEDKYNSAGKLVQKIVHVYDGEQISEKQYYTGSGYPFKKEYYAYSADERTNISTISYYKYENKEEVYDGKTEYSDYNSFGKYKMKVVYDKTDQQLEITQYSYDDQGNIIESTISKPKKIEASLTVSEAESVGKEVDESESSTEISEEQEWLMSSGATYEYSYDDLFNWIQKITYKIDEATGKKNRQFYYERIIEYR